MAISGKSENSREEEFDRLVHHAYYEAIERGETPKQEDLVAKHPKFADELKSFFADVDYLHKAAAVPKGSDDETRPNVIAQGDRIQYIGEYRILEEIARGGMGVVFKARQEKLNRTVALKMILAGRLASDSDIDRFRQEARAAAALQHPNIVGIHEVGEYQGHHYFTMDYVEGESLSESLREGSIAPRDAAELLKTICDAVDYAHQKGVLHRDLKPANVLVDEHGIPHVTDFGLAKPLVDNEAGTVDGLTESGQILGTPSYMSPEQAAAKHQLVGVASDVYSLGAILYACLCGRAPFIGESTVETLRQVIDQEPVSVRLLNAKVPKDLETICLKCLSKQPHQRYGTAGELRDDLGRFLDGRTVVARPVSVWGKTLRWSKRNPWIAATALLVVILSIASPVIAIRQSKLRQSADDNATKAASETRRANQEAVAATTNAQEAKHNLILAEQNAEAERRAKEKTEAALAKSHNLLAAAAWDDGRVSDSLLYLHAIPRARRGFEWNLAKRQFLGSDITLYGHIGGVLSVAFNPVDNLIASADENFQIKLWDSISGKEIRTLRGHRDSVTSIRFSVDGATLVSGSHDRTIKLWDARTGALLKTLMDPDPYGQIQSVALSRDGLVIASAVSANRRPGTVTLWNAKTEQILRKIKAHSQWVNCVSLSPAGDRVASGSVDGSVKVWNVESGANISVIPVPRIASDLGGVSATDVCYSPDGRLIAIAVRAMSVTVDRGNISILDAKSGAVLQKIDTPSPTCVSFTPCGTRVAAGFLDTTIKMWNVKEGTLVMTLKGHESSVRGVAFNADGSRIASASDDHTVKVWDAVDGDNSVRLKSQTSATSSFRNKTPVFSSDGSMIAASSGEGICLWNLQDFEERRILPNHSHHVSCLSFSPDNGKIAFGSWDNSVKIWDLKSDRLVTTFAGHRKYVNAVAWSPDGQSVASGAFAGVLRLWDAETGQQMHSMFGHDGVILDTEFSPDGLLLASACGHGIIKIWDVNDGALIRSISSGFPVKTVAFVNDASTICAAIGVRGSPGSLAYWDVRTGKRIKTIRAHRDDVNWISFGDDGKRILSSGEDGTIKLWSAENGEELRVFPPRSELDRGRRTVFSPSGGFIASSTGSAIELWNAMPTEDRRISQSKGRAVTSCVFSEDGARVIGNTRTGERIVWDADSGTELRDASDVTGAGNVSSDGRWMVLAFPNDVRIIDLRLKDEPGERRIRERNARIDPHWHMEQARAAEVLSDWYAATFHYLWAMKSAPDRFAFPAKIADCSEKLRSSIWDSTSDARHGDQIGLMPRGVSELLETVLDANDANSVNAVVGRSEHEPSLGEQRTEEQENFLQSLHDRFKFAEQLEEQRKYGKAREIYQAVIREISSLEQDPLEGVTLVFLRSGRFWVSLASIHAKLAELERSAGNDASEAVAHEAVVEFLESEVDLENPKDWAQLAISLARLGRKEEAMNAFDEMVQRIRTATTTEQAKRYTEAAEILGLFPTQGMYSPWMSDAACREVARAMISREMRLETIEGRIRNGLREYRATYIARNGVLWAWQLGVAEQDYKFESQRLRKMGFAEMHHSFLDDEGEVLHSAIWENWPAIGSDGRIEGEAMVLLEVDRGRSWTQDMASFGKGKWSGGKQRFWMNSVPPARLCLGFTLPKGGEYSIGAVLTTAPDYAIVDLELDDVVVGNDIDLYRPDGVDTTGRLDLGVHTLKAGRHQLLITIKGANESSDKKHGFGIDYLELREM